MRVARRLLSVLVSLQLIHCSANGEIADGDRAGDASRPSSPSRADGAPEQRSSGAQKAGGESVVSQRDGGRSSGDAAWPLSPDAMSSDPQGAPSGEDASPASTHPGDASPDMYLAPDAASKEVGTDPPARWSKVLDDEFDTFETSNWEKSYYWGNGTIGNAPQSYQSPNNVAVQAGQLVLSAKRGSETSAPYSGSVVETYSRHAQTYGYFEIRAQLPSGNGVGPWALLYAEDKSWPPEIDIFEVPGGASQDKKTVWFTTHYGNNMSKGDSWTSPVRLDEGFHTYGLLWQPNLIVWYVDGVEHFRTDVEVPSKDCYLQIGVVLGSGSSWDGDPTATQLPQTMLLDWVRIWKSTGVQLAPP